MRLFIAEKPELGRAIAEGLDGNIQKFEGYIQKGDNLITWAFGHILKLAEPEVYNEKWKLWNLNDLPLDIKDFKYIPIENSKKQLNIICKLIKNDQVDSIVHCGDADDEGQILIDEIIQYSKTKKSVFRVLINDLTPKAVKAEISKMKPNAQFKGMSERGFARSQADWIVGINLTRAYTSVAQQKSGFRETLTLGRVQTPILGLITARDNEYENFKSIDYYSLLGKFEINGKIFNARLKTEEKIIDENFAKQIKEINTNKTGLISVFKEKKKEYPPLPYSLLILQAECAKLYGYSPDKTLEITQNLREKYKAITYNRSDCQYLPETMFEQAPNIINAIKSNIKNNENDLSLLVENSDLSIKGKAFNDKNISAHYGIIPTQNNFDYGLLKEEEKNIYILIAKRFVIQFFKPREYEVTNFEIQTYDKNIFSTSQSKNISDGFRKFFKQSDEKDNEDTNNHLDISLIENNSICKIKDIEIEKKQTKPRPYYTMDSLLKDLNSVAKYVKDEKIKKLLIEKDKDKKGENGGIGTPATRSTHIKNLIDKGYIEVSKDKKQVVKSTKKGRLLISLAPETLKYPDITALWFEQQKMIEQGTIKKEDFLQNILKEVNNEILKIKENVSMNQFSQLSKDKQYSCPECKNGVLIKRKNTKGTYWWGCSEYKNGCKFMCFDEKNKPKLK